MKRLISHDYIYLVPLVLSAIASLKSFRQHWSLPFRSFSLFLILSLIIETAAILWKWGLNKTDYWNYSPSNLWIYNAFTPIRFAFIFVFYYQILNNSQKRLRLMFLAASALIIFSFLNYFFLQTPHHVNSWAIVPVNIFTIYLALAFFYMVLHENKIISLRSSPEVWISLGCFLYYSGTLPFFMFYDYLIQVQSPILGSFIYINDFLNIVMYSMYSIAFLCRPQIQK